MNYRDIKSKRGNFITSFQYSDVRPSSGNTFIPCVVLAKGVILKKLSLFFGKKKQEIRIYIL